MLNKQVMQKSIYSGILNILMNRNEQASSGNSDEDPKKVIEDFAQDLSTAISNAVDVYVRGGQIIVGPTNITVTSTTPGTPAVVAPATPAVMT